MVWILYIIELMMVRRTGKNNFRIVEMRWHQDVRYNRGLKWLRGENPKRLECETIGRDKLRWEYSGTTYETSTLEIDAYEIMVEDGWKA